MINLTEKDKEYIEKTEGDFAARGVSDHLYILRREYGEGVVDKLQKEINELGYDIDIKGIKENKNIPASFYIVFLLIERELFNLDEDGMRKIGKESAKRSFLLRFASNLLISMKTLSKHANTGWRKYYEKGNLYSPSLDMEKKEAVVELTDFVGHPVHCRYLEGYFSQLVYFVTGKEATCREEECMFEGGGDIHRFVIKWE